VIKIAEAQEVRTQLIAVFNRHVGKWLTRADVARGLGKSALNPADILMLSLMTESGDLERQLVDGTHAGIRRFRYRLSADK
jgi:hypothetical protein